MARLTLSEQVLALQEKIAFQETALDNARKNYETLQEVIKENMPKIATLQAEVATIPNLRDQIAKLTKERDDAKGSLAYHSAESLKHSNELEQAHAVLDGVEGAPTRTYRPEDSSYDRQRNVVTRLAGAFLAIAQKGGVK